MSFKTKHAAMLAGVRFQKSVFTALQANLKTFTGPEAVKVSEEVIEQGFVLPVTDAIFGMMSARANFVAAKTLAGTRLVGEVVLASYSVSGSALEGLLMTFTPERYETLKAAVLEPWKAVEKAADEADEAALADAMDGKPAAPVPENRWKDLTSEQVAAHKAAAVGMANPFSIDSLETSRERDARLMRERAWDE